MNSNSQQHTDLNSIVINHTKKDGLSGILTRCDYVTVSIGIPSAILAYGITVYGLTGFAQEQHSVQNSGSGVARYEKTVSEPVQKKKNKLQQPVWSHWTNKTSSGEVYEKIYEPAESRIEMNPAFISLNIASFDEKKYKEDYILKVRKFNDRRQAYDTGTFYVNKKTYEQANIGDYFDYKSNTVTAKTVSPKAENERK